MFEKSSSREMTGCCILWYEVWEAVAEKLRLDKGNINYIYKVALKPSNRTCQWVFEYNRNHNWSSKSLFEKIRKSSWMCSKHVPQSIVKHAQRAFVVLTNVVA
jgi:hypothetical protein